MKAFWVNRNTEGHHEKFECFKIEALWEWSSTYFPFSNGPLSLSVTNLNNIGRLLFFIKTLNPQITSINNTAYGDLDLLVWLIMWIVFQYDIREDEEQNVKLQEIIDLLVAAGYFRARIKGLSAFDKVVGGMIWCMESCNFDVNVDLLFQENSTIGQKM